VPLYIDIHTMMRAVSPEAVAEMRRRDLATQDKYGVRYLKHWFNERPGHVFCLVEAPTKEAAFNVHREAHGSTTHEIYEVSEGGNPSTPSSESS